MKSGLEDRNNERSSGNGIRHADVSMKSGLEDRNNDAAKVVGIGGNFRSQ